MFLISLVSASQTAHSPASNEWYGFEPLISSGHTWNQDDMDDDDDDSVFRKRRHRRKRKISPPRKGW